ncbi:MAG TPA: DUF87 domain-containing protein [Candidatus Kaiserbacteria bacterium]|nr:DUF87 domain-containing protein [Candidatus Kaiserbacteria bacterium]
MEGTPLRTPEEELAYLREQVQQKEKELASRAVESGASQEAPLSRFERAADVALTAHRATPPESTLEENYRITEDEANNKALGLNPDSNDDTMLELRRIMDEHGIKNAFTVLEKLNNPHITDDFHRFLVRYIAAGFLPGGLSEKAPEFKALHMALYEVQLPEFKSTQENAREKPLKEMVSVMEQFYSGLLSVSAATPQEPPYIVLEMAVSLEGSLLSFYVAVPNGKRDMFEKQLLAVFPLALLTLQPNDYNIFVENGTTLISEARLTDVPMLPLKDYTEFDYDPLNTVLNAFAKIQDNEEGAALQIIFSPQGERYVAHFRKVLQALRKGMKRGKAFNIPSTTLGEVGKEFKDFFFTGSKSKEDESRIREEEKRQAEINKNDIEQLEKKISTPIAGVSMRLLVSSPDAGRAEQVLSDIESAFNQFDNTLGNHLEFARVKEKKTNSVADAYSFRLPGDHLMPLSLRELSTMYHFPSTGITSSPHLKQSRFATAPAPVDLPKSGIQIGTNIVRGQGVPIFIDEEDRLRHLYVIGQTGTGKTSFLKTLIEQDMREGRGVCFIDPHGNDIVDVLAAVPPERYEDVIYFDPAYLDRPFGLNMLEYDPQRPEQKTFIVNELFMIFRSLYGDVPESMGPAFEQYFRNSTMLIMEDPESGSTMLDIGRVLSDESFRNMKLSHSHNPVVNQFWTGIATKAGGEASLENIVPYITSKLDDFTSNDFMRPIIGQQNSSFDFRDIIDNKKILLVNLSKGRLGERNANLLGLILVGKIFMAALSRADSLGVDLPPFYFYIDEFQNITTDSIPAILSEARKYKLSLNIAHQFLDQVNEKTRDAVFGNVGNMVVFRVGEKDGEFFAKQFAPTFSASDFVNIENFNAYVKILAHGVPQKPFNIHALNPPQRNLAQVDDLRELSYLTYGRDRATIEEEIRIRYLS